MVNICVIGSSLMWTPALVGDLMAVFDEPMDVRFVDIDPEPAEWCRQWGVAASKALGRKDRFSATLDRRAALAGADAVLITLSTGGLDAMEHDVRIPEKYGIFATVGDTAGPGGWSRSIRNIPVFVEFAADFERICPTAFIANYTNPMSSLTATLCSLCGNPVAGLCHAYFETKDALQQIFNLPDWSGISIEIAGMNHFSWVTDFRIGRENGYEKLRKLVGGGSLRDVMRMEDSDEIGYYSGRELCAAIYDAYGYLPYPADRHISEFFSFALTGRPELKQVKGEGGRVFEAAGPYGAIRTPVSYRRENRENRIMEFRRTVADLQAGRRGVPERSRETGADMIAAYLYNRPMTDAVNALNIGQVEGLPRGACVETMGVVDGLGVRPTTVGRIPGFILEFMRPQAVCQSWIVEGMMNHDRKLLLHALGNDPQCKHLTPVQVRAMAEELFEANKPFIIV